MNSRYYLTFKSTFWPEKPKKLDKTSFNVKFFDWDYLHLTEQTRETYFKIIIHFIAIWLSFNFISPHLITWSTSWNKNHLWIFFVSINLETWMYIHINSVKSSYDGSWHVFTNSESMNQWFFFHKIFLIFFLKQGRILHWEIKKGRYL